MRVSYVEDIPRKDRLPTPQWLQMRPADAMSSVIFSSGTTGWPKGTYRRIQHTPTFTKTLELGTCSADVVAQFSSPFDISERPVSCMDSRGCSSLDPARHHWRRIVEASTGASYHCAKLRSIAAAYAWPAC